MARTPTGRVRRAAVSVVGAVAIGALCAGTAWADDDSDDSDQDMTGYDDGTSQVQPHSSHRPGLSKDNVYGKPTQPGVYQPGLGRAEVPPVSVLSTPLN